MEHVSLTLNCVSLPSTVSHFNNQQHFKLLLCILLSIFTYVCMLRCILHVFPSILCSASNFLGFFFGYLYKIPDTPSPCVCVGRREFYYVSHYTSVTLSIFTAMDTAMDVPVVIYTHLYTVFNYKLPYVTTSYIKCMQTFLPNHNLSSVVLVLGNHIIILA